MPAYTFGFEAEFATRVEELARSMYDAGHTYDRSIHNYTCDCDGCVVSHYDSGIGERRFDGADIWRLRIKHDSSCGGEVISKVWQSPTDRTLVDLWKDIEREAVVNDCEPGLSAGFHVHVGRNHLTTAQRGRLILAVAAWEPILLKLAAGRWSQNRGWNMTLEHEMYPTFSALCRDAGVECFDGKYSVVLAEYLSTAPRAVASDFYRDIAKEHAETDRHTTLAFSPRYPTMEFRLWNSTRAAWRMELWCRLSLLLADPTFTTLMIDTAPTTISDFVNLIATHGDASHERTFWLAARQAEYLQANSETLEITLATPLTVV